MFTEWLGKSLVLTCWHDLNVAEKEMFDAGGDEDWVLYVPASAKSGCAWPLQLDAIVFAEEREFTYYEWLGFPHWFDLPDGALVVVFTH